MLKEKYAKDIVYRTQESLPIKWYEKINTTALILGTTASSVAMLEANLLLIHADNLEYRLASLTAYVISSAANLITTHSIEKSNKKLIEQGYPSLIGKRYILGIPDPTTDSKTCRYLFAAMGILTSLKQASFGATSGSTNGIFALRNNRLSKRIDIFIEENSEQ